MTVPSDPNARYPQSSLREGKAGAGSGSGGELGGTPYCPGPVGRLAALAQPSSDLPAAPGLEFWVSEQSLGSL